MTPSIDEGMPSRSGSLLKAAPVAGRGPTPAGAAGGGPNTPPTERTRPPGDPTNCVGPGTSGRPPKPGGGVDGDEPPARTGGLESHTGGSAWPRGEPGPSAPAAGCTP